MRMSDLLARVMAQRRVLVGLAVAGTGGRLSRHSGDADGARLA